MFTSYSTLRRFTPPTCTLEIRKKKPSLWFRKKSARSEDILFKLSFDDPRLAQEQQVSIEGDYQQLEQLTETIFNYVENFLGQSFAQNYTPTIVENGDFHSTLATIDRPKVKQQGLVAHQLYLGSLAKDRADATIELSAVQLFDLLSALEAYQEQILPWLQNQTHSAKLIPLWGSIAAVTVAAIGLTTAGIKLATKSTSELDTVASTSETASLDTKPNVRDVVPPKVAAKNNRPTPQPKLTDPLSSIEKLPPPPPVDLPKPQPNIPDPAKFPFPLEEIPTSSPSSSVVKLPPKLSQPTEAEKPAQVESTITIKPETKIAATDNLPNNSNLETETRTDNYNSPDHSEAETTLPSSSETIAVIPQTSSEKKATARINSSSPLDRDRKPKLSETEESNSQLAATSNSSTIKEIEAYFQQQWQPPTELKQTLEYRLFLNPNGSISRVTPLGKAAEIYLDRTNIPLRGETFISPLANQQAATVRLLLSPDGEITTFLEGISTN